MNEHTQTQTGSGPAQARQAADTAQADAERAVKLAIDQDKQVLDHIKLYRDRWETENTLMNQRLTWLLVSQALLFAAFGAMAVKAAETEVHQERLQSFLTAIPMFGFALALVTCGGIASACFAQYFLYRNQKECLVVGARPVDLGVRRCTTYVGWLSCLLVPCIFIGGWIWFHHVVASPRDEPVPPPLASVKGKLPPGTLLWLNAGSASCSVSPAATSAGCGAPIACVGAKPASSP